MRVALEVFCPLVADGFVELAVTLFKVFVECETIFVEVILFVIEDKDENALEKNVIIH